MPDDKSVQVWNYEDGTRVFSWNVPNTRQDVKRAKFVAQKNWIVVKRYKDSPRLSCLQVYGIQALNLRHIKTLDAPDKKMIYNFAIHHVLPYLVASFEGEDRNISLWDWDRGWEEVAFEGHSDDVHDVKFHPTESLICASVSYDCTIKIWDMEQRCASRTLKDPKMETPVRLDFCSDHNKESLLVTGHTYGEVRVWDYRRGECKAKLLGQFSYSVDSCFFHPNLPYIFAISYWGEGIGLWSESSYQQVLLEKNPGIRYPFIAVPCRHSNLIMVGGRGGFAVVEVVTSGKEKKKVEQKQRSRLLSLEKQVNEQNLMQKEEVHAKSEWKWQMERRGTTNTEQEYSKVLQKLKSEHQRMEKNWKLMIEELEQRLGMEVGSGEVREYSYKELQDATDNFDITCAFGDHGDQNGSNTIYRGKLCSEVTAITVKQLGDTDDGPKLHPSEFRTKVVDRLKVLRHPHLLTLLGVCCEEKCLVYEHMENGSIKDCITCGEGQGRRCLPWYARFRIMAEVARAVCVLHSSSPATGHRGQIIHGAIKPANIFLDESFAAKLGEVDKALLVADHSQGARRGAGETSMRLVLGSNSQYIAPEYFQCGVLNEKTDIYALGITLLEMLTGKFWNTLGIVEDAIEDEAAFKNALDPNAGCWDIALAQEIANLGLSCASFSKHCRPNKVSDGIMPVLEQHCPEGGVYRLS
ncbi:hypothetical protein CBR_g53696 [Chara braunii]|uniref:Protein kinase domain-containing protein n=1 Tax=Chara braunii TaxID=69332 RepID=A0A388MB54_CHABU|nr:hypothetical protein CBR_g53696 [Chara braunii]|eukprot:GBG91807.1 hypothetical protein CBR_g53696 [Chara braunii]